MSIWALLSLIPGIIHILLGTFVYFKRIKNPLNSVFTLYILSLILWCITEFVHRLDVRPETANLWIKMGGFGWSFMFSLWAHFILIFARQKRILKNKWTYIGLYGISTIILILFLKTDLIYEQEPVRFYFGYTVLPGKYIWIFMFYYALLFLISLYSLIKVIRHSTILEKKQANPILFGTGLPMILATATNVILPGPENSTPELGTTFTIIWAVSVFYAVLKHNLFIIKPSLEESIETPAKYHFERGLCYFIREEKPDKGYEIFYDQITHDDSGFCITKLAPVNIRKRYKLKSTPILWLTFKNLKNTISPKDLDGLVSMVAVFVRQTENALLFFDCFDQIKFANGIKKALPLLIDLKKLCHETNAITLLSINPKMFDRQQWAYIETELTGVDI
ncbi:DUF835 domain-containing protein [candidate division KSB1 bacterium]|nr:DUF835 domain-containing protein [candidate division KSB1 bacterium]